MKHITKWIFNIFNRRKLNKKEFPPTVSYLKIFTYATLVEKLATLTGIVLGFLSGGGVCFNLLQIGEMSTALLERTTLRDRQSTHLPLTAAFGGGRVLLCNATHEDYMTALKEDGLAMAIGVTVNLVLCFGLCIASVSLINWSALKQVKTLHVLFFKTLLQQDLSWFDTQNNIHFASTLSENLLDLRKGLGDQLAIIINLMGTASSSLLIAFLLGWELTLACSSVVLLSVISAVIFYDCQGKTSEQEVDSYNQAGKHAEEVFRSIKTVAAFAGESKEIERYTQLLGPGESLGRKRGLLMGILRGVSWFLTFGQYPIAVGYGARLILESREDTLSEPRYVLGTIIGVLFLTYMTAQSITYCLPCVEGIAKARIVAANIFKLLAIKPKISISSKQGIIPKRANGEIVFEKVSFAYPSRPEVSVINNLSIHVKAGEYVALVGPSGSGKSTILQLLQRQYDPVSGSIKFDKGDLKKLNLQWLRSTIGLVGQEPVLFRGTIHENIAIGYPEVMREEVQRVAEVAYAHDFITKLPNGYDTVIGERGASLSGGQKQRIAIARSLLREPAVLLLDEATSALDPHSERQVQAALDRASLGRTTIMVSHRLPSIVKAHRIIYVKKGSIVEEGTHEELMDKKKYYYELVTTWREENDDAIQGDIIWHPNEINDNKIDCERTEQLEPQIDFTEQPDTRKTKGKRHLLNVDMLIDGIGSMKSNCMQVKPVNEDEEVLGYSFPRLICLYSEDIFQQLLSDWQILKMNAPEWATITVGLVAAFLYGASFPIFAFLFGYTTEAMSCTNPEELLYHANIITGLFLIVSVVSSASMFVENITLSIAGLKITTRLRIQYFSAFLRQDMEFFDKESNSYSALCTSLNSDTANVQGATGKRISILLQAFSSVFIAVVICLYISWEMTLLSIAFLPLVIGSFIFEGLKTQKWEEDQRNAVVSATSIATEAVLNIKTVQSLGIERLFAKKFEVALERSCDLVGLTTRWRGLVLASASLLPFSVYCYAASYGAYLVSRAELDYQYVILINEALTFGSYMLGQSFMFAPNIKIAKKSATRIINLINRKPKIGGINELNEASDWVASGSFSIKNVEFSYPTRPQQRVLRGIELRVEAGKTVALVGTSGCGKTRALIRSPRLLLLDEATSALDANSERVVSEALEAVSAGLTCVMIAHRLSTVKNADLICVIVEGQVVEKGSHTELINAKGHYWRMRGSRSPM